MPAVTELPDSDAPATLVSPNSSAAVVADSGLDGPSDAADGGADGGADVGFVVDGGSSGSTTARNTTESVRPFKRYGLHV